MKLSEYILEFITIRYYILIFISSRNNPKKIILIDTTPFIKIPNSPKFISHAKPPLFLFSLSIHIFLSLTPRSTTTTAWNY